MATVVRIGAGRHNGAGSSQIITISWAAAKLINMKATWERKDEDHHDVALHGNSTG
jgi:hypothetical protein